MNFKRQNKIIRLIINPSFYPFDILSIWIWSNYNLYLICVKKGKILNKNKK
jgi:hypothetical protein